MSRKDNMEYEAENHFIRVKNPKRRSTPRTTIRERWPVIIGGAVYLILTILIVILGKNA